MGPEEEFELYDRDNSWLRVFQQLHATDAVRKHEYSLQASKRTENRYRNRYRDVIPYDHSRIQLQRAGIDYINASLVLAHEADRAYILTQGPLPDTSGHFWLMVWEQKSHAVLMLNRIIEKGQLKCHPYYPTGTENEGEDEIVFDDVGLKVTYIEERESNANYTARAYYLTDIASSESREVIQFHYTAWPDFGVPSSPSAFLDFLWAVRESGALDTEVHGPPVIHCSAGIGRSGTFCLVDACLVLVEKNGSTSEIQVLDTLMDMRRYRMGLVQTHDQLRFSYLSIIEGAKRIIRIPSRDSGYDNSIEHNQLNRQHSGRTELSSDEDPIEVDGSSECDNTPPPIPPRVDRSCRELPQKHNGTANGATAYENVGKEEDFDDEDEDEDEEYNVSLGNRADVITRLPPNEIRRRPRAEREKNPEEQIARMKRRQREKDIYPKPGSHAVHLYAVGATVIALVAVGSYGLYRYYYR